jgi:hypothetical protein
MASTLKTWLSRLGGVFGALGVASYLKLPVATGLWGFIVAQIGTAFPAVSVAAFAVAPQVAWLPADPLQSLAIVLGGVFVAAKLDKLWDAFNRRFLTQ